jgi:antitoxin (DNA-binding transcriptional repressor) of toxin-antitoxin stability system
MSDLTCEVTLSASLTVEVTVSGIGTSYVLPEATATVLGGVKQGSGVTIAADGTLSAAGNYTLPVATGSVLGGVKDGDRITIAADGTISADVQTTDISGKVDKVTGKSLVSDTEISKIHSLGADNQDISGFTIAPATNTADYIPQWNGTDSKTLKDGLAVPTGGLAGLTALGNKLESSAFSDSGVTGKLITGFSSGAGTVEATDTILQAINKLNGNIAGKEVPLTFGSGVTRTVNAVANDLITGKAGGQTITFGVNAGDYGIYKSTTGVGTPTGIAYQWTGGTNGGTVIATMLNNGNVGIGTTAPTARLHLPAGTATASTGTIKFTSSAGVFLTTPEAGVLEYSVDDYYLTIATGAARKGIMLNDGTNLTSGRLAQVTTNGRLTNAGDITGSGNRVVVAAASGTISATSAVFDWKITDATTITNITNAANWTLGIYGGAAITGQLEGMIYVTDDYEYKMYTDTYVYRTPRA